MIPRYSPIAPIELLEQMHELEITQGHHTLGDYLLLLTHDVLTHPIRYEDLINSIRHYNRGDDDTFIIMDNSIIEMGSAMPAEDVIEAACVVEASCIMTPDAIGGFNDTIALVKDQAQELEDANFPLMRVPQGTHYTELVECVNWLHDYLPAGKGKPEYWGVPRWIATELGSRKPLVEYIGREFPNSWIHLLGMSKWFEDDMECSGMNRVMGIDSANPMVLGREGSDIKETRTHLLRLDYWDDTKLHPMSVANVRYVHNAVG